MPVTHMTIKCGLTSKSRPRAGDRRTDKDGITWIRRCKVFRNTNGRVDGYDCTNGRQNYVWIREGDSYP